MERPPPPPIERPPPPLIERPPPLPPKELALALLEEAPNPEEVCLVDAEGDCLLDMEGEDCLLDTEGEV